MNLNPILLADADWFGLLIAVVMGIVWVLNQVFGKLAQPQPPKRPNQPVPRPPVNPNVQNELETFLRRAAQQRAGQDPRPQPPAAPPAPTPTRTLVAPRTEPFAQPLRRPSPAELVEVEMIDDGEGPRGPSVGEHVKQHLDTRQFSQRAAHMTTVDNADEQMADHLHQTFGRQLGTLATSAMAQSADASAAQAATSAKPRISAAAGIAALLRDPRSAQNAVILHEILARPEARWSP